MSETVITPAKLDAIVVQCGNCKGKLFLNWGFELMYTPEEWKVSTFAPESLYKESVKSAWLHVCASCKTPYIFDENKLYDVSGLVDAEDVQAALETLRNTNVGGKAKNIDP